MIFEFVDKIVVRAPGRSSGERMQEVDVYLKFIGKFDVCFCELGIVTNFPRPQGTFSIFAPDGE